MFTVTGKFFQILPGTRGGPCTWGPPPLDFAIALTLVCDDDDLEDELVAEKLDELLLLLVDEYDEVVAAPPPVVVPPTPTPPLCETSSDILHNLAASAPAVDRMLSNTSYLKHHNKTLLFIAFMFLYRIFLSCYIALQFRAILLFSWTPVSARILALVLQLCERSKLKLKYSRSSTGSRVAGNLRGIYAVRMQHLAKTDAVRIQHTLCRNNLAVADSTCRLDDYEVAHLLSTSFLEAILERVDGRRINIFPRQAIASVYNPLRKEVQTRTSHRQFFFTSFHLVDRRKCCQRCSTDDTPSIRLSLSN